MSTIRVLPANEAPWTDLDLIMGPPGDAYGCQCQWFKLEKHEWRAASRDERADRLRTQAACGNPDSPTTSGLIAYVGDEPVGWCAVEPRSAYLRLRKARTPWTGRDEDPADDSVWAVTCFQVRAGFRRRGVSAALARASVEFARERGARAVEGYPTVIEPGKSAPESNLYVGTVGVFEQAGFVEVAAPSTRRRVMRVEL